jgi:hypothetical protein
MAQPNNSLLRKPSKMGLSSLSRSNTITTSSDMRSSTPQSSKYQHDRRHTGLRSLFGKFRELESNFDMLTPPSSSSLPTSPPVISKLAKAFVDSLNATQLSNFFVWMLYYDTVELPNDPVTWFKRVSSMDMRGWVALGDFLTKSQEAGAGHGFELIVLDSICDRIQLPRATVHALLIQFADPEKMKYSAIASTITNAQQDGQSALEVLETAQGKLHELFKLAVHLKPQEGSRYDEWHGVLQKRIREFLHLVVGPRIAHLRSGKPLVTSATSEQLPKEIKEGIKLNYLYEAMQEERVVPLARYGIFPGSPSQGHLSTPPPSSSPRPGSDEETGRARNHAIQLMVENRELRAQVAGLQHDKEKLTESNEKLALKVATLGRLQPPGYLRSSSYDDRPLSLCSPNHNNDEQPMTLHVPQLRPRPRSLSADSGPKLAAELEAKLDITGATHTHVHKRQHSEVLSWKYEDLFSPLCSPGLSPSLRLSDPITGQEDTFTSPLTSPTTPFTQRTSSPVTPVRSQSERRFTPPTCTRRSGMIFDRESMGYLAGLGESTPIVKDDEEDSEGDDGWKASTPTPAQWGSGRFDLLE